MILAVTLLVLNSLFLFCGSIYHFFIYANWLGFTKFIFGSLFFTDAVLFLLVAWGILKKIRAIYYFGLFLVLTNIVLIIFDQIGLADLAFLVLNLATLVSLVLMKKKSKFFKPAK